MAEILADLCGTDPADPFPLWNDGAVGRCFNQLVLNTLTHVIFTLASSCYLGIPRFQHPGHPSSHRWRCRIIASFLVSMLSLVDLITVLVIFDTNVYVEVLADSVCLLAWIVHGLALIILYRSVYRISRGPVVLAVMVLLPAPALVITLVWYCQTGAISHPLQPLHIVRLVIVSMQLVLLLGYLVAFIAPSSRRNYHSSINDASERTPLITHSLFSGEQIVAEDGEGWFSRIYYCWLNPLMMQGYAGNLNSPQNVYLLPYRLRTKNVRRLFDSCWQKCKEEKASVKVQHSSSRPTSTVNADLQNGPNHIYSSSSEVHQNLSHQPQTAETDVRLFSVLHKAVGLRYYCLGILKLFGNLLAFAGPILLNLLVSFMESQSELLRWGILYAVGLFASSFVGAIVRNQFSYEVTKVVLAARAAVISAIYHKAVCVSSTTLSHFTVGEIVNFMSTDTDRLVNFFPSFHELWSLPFQFAVTLYLLYLQVGVAFLSGLALAILLVPLNKCIASYIVENNKEMLKHKDSRVKLMTEILSGMRVIKFYTWEQHFLGRVGDCRKKELNRLKALKYLDAVCVYLWAALPVVMSILTFVTYVLLGHELTAAKVFTALALVGMLILPLNCFPWVLNGILEAKVSLDRIERFLQLPDQDIHSYYSIDGPNDPNLAAELLHSSFSWSVPVLGNRDFHQTSESASPTKCLQLSDLNLHVNKGTLIGVVGKVGCGKSSLLSAISGELNWCGGTIYVSSLHDGFGLAVQEPWIQYATVQENILFGKRFNSKLYNDVIEACALTDDLNILPAGDQTEVGENGVTLSGGQKARIALARAVYLDKDMYLLDDPLSAVDSDVADHIMEKCILGLLKSKTRILCTHRIEFLEMADKVVLMDSGRIVKTGAPSEILPLVEAVPRSRRNCGKYKDKGDKDEENLEIEEEEANETMDSPVPEDRTSIQEEKKVGAVAFPVYKAYWFAVGSCLAFSVLLSLLLMQASRNVSDWWLSNWISSLQKTEHNSTRDLRIARLSPHLLLFSSGGLVSPITMADTAPTHPNSTSNVKFYLTVYGCIAVANTIFTALRAFLFAYGAICAATVIHNKLLHRVLKATVTFFDTTPTGRIVNRFSSDLYSVDDSLPFILNIFLANIYNLLGMLIVISYGLPWILLVIAPLAVLYFFIQRYYRCTSRELKRLYSITLSPIYTHFSETLTGLTTIRALRATNRFEEQNETRLEVNLRCLFACNAAVQWLDIRLQMIGILVITGIATIAVIQHVTRSVDPGLVGLALSYALSVTNLLSNLITSFTQTETMMVSVERAEEYSTDITVEPQDGLYQVSPAWPDQGQIEFQNVVLVYRPGLPNALDGLNFTICPGEKVGIVGRTGSGKSTIFLALFRMVELTEGQILVDRMNIRNISLKDLRSRLSVIPQDPFLFSGTVRENLDPSSYHTDEMLYDVLEQCHLKDVIIRMGGLNAELNERGRSLSVGQRQLMCLARALLTQAKILCIDEATASVDQKTDQLLQQTIREKFADKTVLTIAHRLNTIMDSDKVLVIHAGKVVQCGAPEVLSEKLGSYFAQSVYDGQE
ncbi:ATP-binding cassette sub-family C member 10 [Protopterus annectens]|uniref:ATP-binding cassette sub-family C member 10 n=1 Tax=Protopterus annectens TaxID=7888 RepID=UPI001CFAB8D4|nr:ATP-binding cassette sub-family C member 10 [Protopterus annectens]